MTKKVRNRGIGARAVGRKCNILSLPSVDESYERPLHLWGETELGERLP